MVASTQGVLCTSAPRLSRRSIERADRTERFYLGFTMSSRGWTANDVRINNLAETDWHELEGNFFAAPLGNSFHGDIDVTVDNQASIEFVNATVSPFGAR